MLVGSLSCLVETLALHSSFYRFIIHVHFCISGGIDAHTHLQLPFMGTTTADDFYTGKKEKKNM